MISMVVPVLGRPASAQPLVDSIRAHTAVEHEIIFLCSPGDDAQIDACRSTQKKVIVVDWPSGRGDAARKWNRGGEASVYPFIFCAADDLEFTDGWDVNALTVAESTGASVIGTNDSANPLVKRGKHSTHTMVRKSYVDEVGLTWDNIPGHIYAPCYDHQSVDQELVQVAKERGIWAFSRRSVVIHHHPFYSRHVKRDPTYDKALAGGHGDIMLFKERMRTLSSSRRTR